MLRRKAILAAAWLAISTLAFGQDVPHESASASSCVYQESTSCNPRRFYGSIEYLLFNFRDGPAPALIQHVPTNQVFSAPLPEGAAITMYGDGIRQHAFNGARAELGYWFNDNWAVEFSGFQFESKNKQFRIESNGEPSIGRHYTDITSTATPNTYLIFAQPVNPADPAAGSSRGFLDASSPIQLWGAEINVKTQGYSVFSDWCDVLVGFRYLDLRDGIFITGFTDIQPANVSYFGEDRFYATNQFYGPQIGFNSEGTIGGGFTFGITGKLAMGGVQQRVLINGITIERVNGVITRTAQGHVLTQPTNIGEYERGQFAFVPELGLKLGYNVGQHVNIAIGYNILAITSVVRPGSAIDEDINPNVNPFLNANNTQSTERRPAFDFHGTDFWAQGITFGVSVRY